MQWFLNFTAGRTTSLFKCFQSISRTVQIGQIFKPMMQYNYKTKYKELNIYFNFSIQLRIYQTLHIQLSLPAKRHVVFVPRRRFSEMSTRMSALAFERIMTFDFVLMRSVMNVPCHPSRLRSVNGTRISSALFASCGTALFEKTRNPETPFLSPIDSYFSDRIFNQIGIVDGI